MPLKSIRDTYNTLSREYQGGVDIKEEALLKAATLEKEKRDIADAKLKKEMQGSFQQLVDLYLEYVQTNFSKHYYDAMKNAFALNLAGFDCQIKANEIDEDHIISILTPINSRKAFFASNSMRSFLSAMFTWGKKLDKKGSLKRFDVSFYISANPVTEVEKALDIEPAGKRWLNNNEVWLFWNKLETNNMSTLRKNILRLMLTTGARVEAISTLKWTDLDLVDKLITIRPEYSKNGKYWVIPLGDIAYNIMLTTPKLHDIYLFPSNKGDKPLASASIGKAVTRLCKQSSIEHFSPRDLRRTWKTISGMAGIDKSIRDKIQNHSDKDISSIHYDRHDYLKEKRAAIEVWNDYLKNILEGKPTVAEEEVNSLERFYI
jgi:integrase